jgi:cellulose synthase/poly-beta-1,6-N-acetylglucosamine synthase-like glycosyltransferase
VALSPLFLDDVLFFAAAISIFVEFACYPLLLAVARKTRPRALVQVAVDIDDGALPEIVLVIPTYNEEAFIEDKLRNIATLAYPPRRLRVLVADGGSSDETVPRIDRTRASLPFAVDVIACEERGKIPQLNEALDRISPDAIVAVTDADARIDVPDALLRVVGYLRHNPEVGLVGGWTRPPVDDRSVPDAEHGFWDKQNRLRYVETISFSSSIVVAPFYAFPRRSIDRFPADCIADDVYVSFRHHLAGSRVVYAHDILVTELRCPTDLGALFRHKLRKANAYAVELARMLHLAAHMGRRLKLVYFFKIFQFLYLPWALLGFGLLAAHLVVQGQPIYVGSILVALFATLLGASLSMVPPPGSQRGGLRFRPIVASAILFTIMTVVLCLNTLFFPFWRQGSSYERLGNREAAHG